MIINVCGPPASGKSTLVEKFVSEYKEFVHISIDNYRIKYNDEFIAWDKLYEDLMNTKYVLLESSGISYHIREIELDLDIQSKGFSTIVLFGNERDFEDRLHSRTKAKVPFRYENLSEEGLIKVASRKLPKLYPLAYYIQSDDTVDKEKVYNLFKQQVLKVKETFKKGEIA